MPKKISITMIDKPYGEWTLTKDDLKRFKWWMTYDPIHKPEPMPPLAGWILAYIEGHGFCYGAEKVNLPGSKGPVCRVNAEGYMALSEPIIPTPEEMKKREVLFKEYMKPFLDNFDDIWGDFKHKGKAGKRLAEIQEIFAKIGVFDPETWSLNKKFFSKLEKLSNGKIFDLFFDSLEMVRRVWEIHFEIMYVTFSIYMAFEIRCNELFGFDDKDPLFKKLFQGFDNKVYECDRELWRLAHLAKDLKIAEIFKTTPTDSLLSKLKEAGKDWIDEFDEFLAMYGMKSAVPHDIFKPTWLEQARIPLAIIKDYITKELIDYEAERKKIVEEREKTIKELLKKVPSLKKEEFEELLKAAQDAYCWNEDHNYWIEQMWSASIRYIVLEMGKRLKKARAISEIDAIFFLNPEEIRTTFMLAVNGKYDFTKLVEERKTKRKEAFKKVPPMITGELVREEVKDPVMIKVFGLGYISKPKEKVDIFGYPGSSGIAERIASVILDVNQLHKVKSGSILVTGSTNPAWTPIFSKIKGVVTDMGGTLTHAAIVAREYGIPAVVGTRNATKKIKNGQEIRIDGNKGYIWILKKGRKLN